MIDKAARLLPLSTRGVIQTARRAGVRRSIYRLQRLFRLRVLNPHLGAWLYPTPNVLSSLHSPNQDILEVLTRITELRSNTPVAHGWDVTLGTLRLLNQEPVSLKVLFNWHIPSIPDALWIFRLHSWDWAWPALLDETLSLIFLALWQDWLSNVKIGSGLAWEPEPTSRRLVVWSAAWHLMKINTEELLDSILQQAGYLEHHLEKDLDNNHLVANAKALAWVGMLFRGVADESKRWRKKGFSLLWRALDEQVRDDGGHVENSTSYHVAVWLDALETVFLASACGEPIPESVLDKLILMGDFAHALRRPDGRLPLLNDSIEDEPVALDAALEFESLVYKYIPNSDHTLRVNRSDPPKSRVFPQSGYAVLRSGSGEGNIYLLFDAGNLGPEHSPGHGHADALSFELWGRGRPLIVDPGVYQYVAGRWRNYFRGTATHSTAVIDGLDQSTFVGAFRVAEVAHARLLSARPGPNQQEVVGEHDGYTRLSQPVIHRRSIQSLNPVALRITDEFIGRGYHEIALYFHLAPSQVRLNGTEAVVDYPGGVRLELQILGADRGALRVEQGWISPTWYQKYPSPVLVYDFKSELPMRIRTDLRIL